MPVLHIIATGPMASGKSQLVRYFSQNLPEGYKLKSINAMEGALHVEYWSLVIEKLRVRKPRNQR